MLNLAVWNSGPQVMNLDVFAVNEVFVSAPGATPFKCAQPTPALNALLGLLMCHSLQRQFEGHLLTWIATHKYLESAWLVEERPS